MFNNTPTVLKLAGDLENLSVPTHATGRPRVKSDPCLPQRLPSTGFLQRDAEQAIPLAIIKQLRNTPPSSDEELDDIPPTSPTSPKTPSASKSSPAPITKPAKKPPLRTSWKPWKTSGPETWEILRAIEKKDIMFLMEVRDRAFPMFLRKSGDVTPLLHCMRIGKSHRDMAIILLGTFSRWVNQLTEEDMKIDETKRNLRALKINLKWAIDFGLQTSQNDLLASFMQTLIMSEGDHWVHEQIVFVAHALQEGVEGKPVQVAEHSVRKFASKELKKAEYIAALDDYIANATSDLLMCAAWHCALESIKGEPIPIWYFARDDRVLKAFEEKMSQYDVGMKRTAGRRLRWQCRVLLEVMPGNARTLHQKVKLLAEALDDGPGV